MSPVCTVVYHQKKLDYNKKVNLDKAGNHPK